MKMRSIWWRLSHGYEPRAAGHFSPSQEAGFYGVFTASRYRADATGSCITFHRPRPRTEAQKRVMKNTQRCRLNAALWTVSKMGLLRVYHWFCMEVCKYASALCIYERVQGFQKCAGTCFFTFARLPNQLGLLCEWSIVVEAQSEG